MAKTLKTLKGKIAVKSRSIQENEKCDGDGLETFAFASLQVNEMVRAWGECPIRVFLVTGSIVAQIPV
jgi:hypothetical protein